MAQSARRQPDRLARLHDRLLIVEERLRVLENDLHETLDQRPRAFRMIRGARRGGPGESGARRGRSSRDPGRAIRREPARLLPADDLLMEVKA